MKLGWAITVHKSQGLTLSKAVIDLTNASWAPALHFVALSRVSRMEDLLLTPFSFDSLNKGDFKSKNAEHLRLQMLFRSTKDCFFGMKSEFEAGDKMEVDEIAEYEVDEAEDMNVDSDDEKLTELHDVTTKGNVHVPNEVCEEGDEDAWMTDVL